MSNITETFGEQWLAIEARPVENVNLTKVINAEGSGTNIEDILNFANRFQKKIESWQKRLERIKKTGQRAVVWGAGAKGVSFLNMLNNQDRIEYVVDVNPRKQGMYIAGTGQEILSPNFIQIYNPDIIIVMNDFYQREIQQIVNDLGVKAELLCA